MKNKLLYMAVFLTGLLLATSCKKDEIGGTLAESMSGEWYVTVVAVDADDNLVYSDDEFFGLGHIHLDTYNTSSNSVTEMWIDDNGNFWEFKGKVDIDMNAMTFSTSDSVQNLYYDMKFMIENGRILKGAATTPSGMPADSIVFNVNFNDDTYPVDYGFTSYRVAGYRYTGLVNDEDH